MSAAPASTATSPPIPARYYPAGGDAHGHAARLSWQDGALHVTVDDLPALTVSAARLRVEARGFNHSQWALNWAGDGHDAPHLLIVDDAVAAPLRAVMPGHFTGGDRQRRGSRHRFGLGVGLLVLLPLLFVAALLLSLDPLTDRVVSHIPPEVERHIGEAVLARTRLEGPLIEAGPAHEALQTIGRRLARPDEALQFHLAERPEINAFAAPGGVVVVNSGLMARAASAEEVAGVLAHEIAHVELRHSLRQIVRSAGLRVIVAALFGDFGALGGWAAQMGELKFSRDAEREADRRALERLAEARIAPHGLLDFFRTLSSLEGGQGTLPALFSTHPANAERIAWIESALARQAPTTVQPLGINWSSIRQIAGNASQEKGTRNPKE